MKQNPFEAFWVKWEAFFLAQSMQAKKEGVMTTSQFAEMRNEFFSLCEKQAKKADTQSELLKQLYILSATKPNPFKRKWEKDREWHALGLANNMIGQSYAFRLVKGMACASTATTGEEKPNGLKKSRQASSRKGGKRENRNRKKVKD